MKNRRTAYFLFLILIVFFIFLSTSETNPSFASNRTNNYLFIHSWGGEEGHLFSPLDVEVGNNNSIYVVNQLSNFVTVINPDTRVFQIFGEYGASPGQFNEPCGIASDSEGNVYVSDGLNDRIQKFSSDGKFILEWGSHGTGDGYFNVPCGLDIDKKDNVYVADIWNHRIQKFSSQGMFLDKWGIYGLTEGGEFRNPQGVAIDKENGFVYVADTFNTRVQKFDLNGNFLDLWDAIYENSNLVLVGVAVDDDGNVYAASHSRINKYTSDGSLLDSWRITSYGISYDENQRLLVAQPNNQLVQKFDTDGNFIAQYGSLMTTDGEFNSLRGIAVDENGYIFTSDSGNHRVQKFNPDGTYLAQWGILGSAPGEFTSPQDIAISSNGDVFVTDLGNHRIQKFSNSGEFITQWGVLGDNVGQFNYPKDIFIDHHGFVYVADTENYQIQKFSLNGDFISQFYCLDPRYDKAIKPEVVVVDESGSVFIATGQMIQKYDSTGNLILQWEDYDVETGEFSIFSDISIFDEILYATDSHTSRIRMFDLYGEYNGQLFSKGSNLGQVIYPGSLDIDLQGNLFVGDTGNRRVQVFSKTLPQPDAYSGLIQNGDIEDISELAGWTYGGLLSISLSENAIQGDYAFQLGSPVEQSEQGESQAWIHQTLFIDPNLERPVLSFKYNMFVNDIMHYSDFFVAIQDGVGLNHLATVLRDGYQPCIPNVAPAAGTDLGWRSVTYDLSKYKGQYVRLVFYNRNLWPNSWGIWTYVDDVRVVDEGSLPPLGGPYLSYLPMMNDYHCDPVPGRGRDMDGELMIRRGPP
jgi:DNA-binding beta-propeller fold protein YncE